MKVKFEIKNERIIGYQTFPIIDGMIDVDSIPNNVTNGEYNLVNGVITKVGYTAERQAEIDNQRLNELRAERTPLLEAFDKYRSAVSYGIVTETEEEHQAILEWYQNLLDLNTQTLNTKEAIPPKIAYYL